MKSRLRQRKGGGDADMNPRLRLALDKARAVNLPKDNVDRAIKKGTGEGNEAAYEDVTYEGYGPGGVAILVKTLTDNRNRTVAEVRSTMTKKGGSMGEAGCVAWIFEQKGILEISKTKADEDKLLEEALEAGAEDVVDDGDVFSVQCAYADFMDVKTDLEGKGYAFEFAEITMKPKNTVPVNVEDLRKIMNITDALEDLDDVQEVYSNFEADDEVMSQLED
ncbi:MAG: YebC/PmpR family DNA-binding transcriptional regulator [Geovibrio sp.]|nr:YebC/PmpR family DNA-binding transcriptional regulator [Geovibrio sp.]